MRSDKILLFAAASALALAAGSANAAVLAFEDFSYADGNLVGKGSAGGGWAGAWATNFGGPKITVTSGVVSGGGSPSERLFRTPTPAVAALTDGSAANDGVIIYVGIDWEFGGAYGGLELVNSAFAGNAAFRLQLGSQSAGPDLRTGGSTIIVPAANFNSPTGVNRYVMAITYNNTTGDMVSLYSGPAGLGSVEGDFTLLGTSAANVNNNFSFDRVGLGLFLSATNQISYADNLVIGTTFASVIPEPSAAALLALGGLVLLRRRGR